jgi:hypothetical protein
MRTVFDLLQSAQALEPDALMEAAMAAGGEVYVGQQQKQMFDGINSEGLAIEPEYSPLTVQIKESKGQPSSRVTLKDTGEFYKGIYTDPKGDKMYVDSKDSKSNELQEKYGDEIFGIQGEYREPYTEKVQEVIITTVREKLRL